MLLGFVIGVTVGASWGFWSGVATMWWLSTLTAPPLPPRERPPLALRQANDIVRRDDPDG